VTLLTITVESTLPPLVAAIVPGAEAEVPVMLKVSSNVPLLTTAYVEEPPVGVIRSTLLQTLVVA